MLRRTLILLSLIFVSANSFAVSDMLFLPNTVIQGGCTALNTGVYQNGFEMEPVYQDDLYSCNPGYYLPENATECALCESDSFCPGGSYAFSDLNHQGIEKCPEGLVSAAGAATSRNECGKVLHVGSDVIYLTAVQQTHPALAVRIGDAVYYAKATLDTKPMNSNTTKSLRLKIGDNEYSIHDNTIKGEQ